MTAQPQVAAFTHQLSDHLDGLARFWRERAVDPVAGYHTVFDAEGRADPETVKSLIAQTRLLWSCTALARVTNDSAFADLASFGLDYLVAAFGDNRAGGWYWTVRPDGTPLDSAKLIYGQSFALYALATCAEVLHDDAAHQAAARTFDAMESAVDARYGGYLENLDRDWNPERTPSGERKSLDIHLHLLESFTVLARLTGEERHRRRLGEVRGLILDKMIDHAAHAGKNQFTVDFRDVLPIVIDRTWIAERLESPPPAPQFLTTSYGHNLELGWLLGEADQVLEGSAAVHTDLVDAIGDHTLTWGYDAQYGGIYREGPMTGPATDTDKEFWQNAEALVGFLHAYQLTGRPEYFDAFAHTWEFANRHLIHPTAAEWRIRTTRDGQVIDGALGNQWTGGYHTVRAAIESVRRLKSLEGPAACDVPSDPKGT
ncbi:MAG: AGE family epimerase/isomerase [Bifidobacteriaceae bacterium]|jgi:mannobiose 2-epimerase|nr:AGE family epimerase/isomerase [Bifidobacteriaceae bacterium]